MKDETQNNLVLLLIKKERPQMKNQPTTSKLNPLNAKPRPKDDDLTPEREQELTDISIIINQIQNG